MPAAARSTLADTELGVYVHFPWCAKKCPYCDFNSHPRPAELPESEYLAALTRDLSTMLGGHAGAVGSVFCGGGTPSLFSPRAFAELLKVLGPRLTPGAEITMEANPGATEHGELPAYRQAGINRLSFGAQSFDQTALQALGRIHDDADIVDSFVSARRAGFENINVDLMYGLPGQLPDQALADLQRAIDLEPDHISWYQLTIEPKTEFARRPPVLPIDSQLQETEERGLTLLETSGYERYEVSAFARPGHRCAHNLNYWRFGNYLGVGAGAHGKIQRDGVTLRTQKVKQPRLYLADPVATSTTQVPARALPGEFMLNALRLRDGVSFDTFTARTGLSKDVISDRWRRLCMQGLVQADRIATTALGYRYVDSIVSEFLD